MEALIMPETSLLNVGDRVAVEGRDDVFFVLSLDHAAKSASLLPNDNGPILNEISVDTLTILRRPEA